MTDNAPQDFASKYTDANLAPDATPYDSKLICNVVRQLENVDNGSIRQIAPAVIAVMLCAQRRGDAVPKLFRDLAEKEDTEQTKALYLSFRHALSITWPFIGLPNCVPACLGLVNELRGRGITMNGQVDRNLLNEADWLVKGKQTRQAVYRSVGNSEVGSMIAQFFPEISHVTNAALWGFLVGGSEDLQGLPLSEMTIAAAIVAMGATRQARSHLKASLGLGISFTAVKGVLTAAEQVTVWNGTKLTGEIDAYALAEEVEANLKKLEAS